MSKSERNILLYLEDIRHSMERIEAYIGNLSFTDFEKDEKTQDAVVRNFIIIGEAANKIPDHIKQKYPDVPWDKMYGLRNIVSHEYHGVDYEIIWKIATDQLPDNLSEIKEIITTESSS